MRALTLSMTISSSRLIGIRSAQYLNQTMPARSVGLLTTPAQHASGFDFASKPAGHSALRHASAPHRDVLRNTCRAQLK